MNGAVKGGGLRIVKWLHSRNYPIAYSDIILAVTLGRLDILKFFYIITPIHFSSFNIRSAFDKCAENGYYQVLKYLFKRCQFPGMFSWNMLNTTAQNGHFEIFKWILQQVRPEETRLYPKIQASGVARNGHLEIVKYLNSKEVQQRIGVDWTGALDQAAYKGHLNVVKYIHYNVKQYKSLKSSAFTMESGCKMNRLDIVSFLHFHRKVYCNVYCYFHAATRGHLKIIQFLHLYRKEKFPQKTLSIAITNGHLDVVVYLLENEICSLTGGMVLDIINLGNFDMLQYISKSIENTDLIRTVINKQTFDILEHTIWFKNSQLIKFIIDRIDDKSVLENPELIIKAVGTRSLDLVKLFHSGISCLDLTLNKPNQLKQKNYILLRVVTTWDIQLIQYFYNTSKLKYTMEALRECFNHKDEISRYIIANEMGDNDPMKK
eukprot:gene3933-4909_t